MTDVQSAAGGREHVNESMRILVENSEYWLRNNGDLAMMDVTIRRLRQRFPSARIAVLTDSPVLLRAYFPDAEGISVFDSDPWGPLTLVERLAGRLGPALVGPPVLGWLRIRRGVLVWFPSRVRGLARRLRGKARTLSPPVTPDLDDVIDRAPFHAGSAAAARGASLVLALGGGYLTDADRTQTIRVLNLLDHAADAGVPFALLGQGLGPLNDTALRGRAAQVLPRAGLVALRERLRGPEILRAAGLNEEQILVTGDDAIELSYAERRDALGSDIGVCLRVAGYSPVEEAAKEIVGATVREAALKHSVGLAPLIVAEYMSQDRRSTLPLVEGAARVVRPLPRYVRPRRVAQRVAQCRLIVTGAYHLAVFALSQGIPVVALTSSAYYDDKFLGLADMFGTGLTLVRLDDSLLADRLREAIESAWNDAPDVRDDLRAAAREQIRSSRQAFDRATAMVGGDRG